MDNQELDSLVKKATQDLNKVLSEERPISPPSPNLSKEKKYNFRDIDKAATKPFPSDEIIEEEAPFCLSDLLVVMQEHNSSDMHIKEGSPPMVRIDGELFPVGNYVLSANQCEKIIFDACSLYMQNQLKAGKAVDFAHVNNGIRYRVNAFMQKSTVSASIRMIRDKIPNFKELLIPLQVSQMLDYKNGLVLVTGPAGCGKSTTLASMIDFINQTKPVHIITIEDPIEYVHTHKKSLITQREVGSDTESFESALKYSLRQDPNVILIGEMRDPDTIMTAARSAETGHLVLSTLHTPSCVQAISRMLDVFTGENRRQMRLLLANNLRGVISQRLLPRLNEEGRVPAVEIMMATPTITSLILEGNINEIYAFMKDGKIEGMQTLNQSLLDIYNKGLVSYEDIMNISEQKTELRMMIEGHSTEFGTMMDHQNNKPTDEDNSLMSWI